MGLSSSKFKNEQRMNGIARVVLGVTSVLLLAGCVNVFKVIDLRESEENPFSSQEKAKRLMEEMGEAHGIEKWDSILTYNIVFQDEFYGFIGKQAHPFKEQKMTFSLNYIPQTFDGQMEIISGKEKGTVWGIDSWETYFKNDDGNFELKHNKDMVFWIPTYQYFIEFPSRIQEATSIDYIGEKVVNGVKTEGVIASWKTVEPQKDFDQYIIWIDSETKRIVKIEYTVRDMYRFIKGAASFNNYKEFDGMLFPTEMPVESNLTKELLHTMSIKGFTPDHISMDSLVPLFDEE